MPLITLPSEAMEISSEEVAAYVSMVDFMYLFAVMCHPNDEDAQMKIAEAISYGETKYIVEQCQKEFGSMLRVIIDADYMLSMMKAADLNTEMQNAGNVTGLGGSLSGMVLGWTVFRAERPDTRASASPAAAFRMIEEAMSKGGKRGAGVENMKRNIWPTYRPVAHLWAALHVWTDKEYGYEALITPEGLRLFLMMAEWFRAKGEAFTPLRSDTPLLLADEMWRLPSEVVGGWPSFSIQSNVDAWDLRKRMKKRD